ncbi:DUF6290 family protein [Jiella sp. M17.18]|uniref:type II toxin-antitoxin system RelB family antitoxin n=1 Tax=Jiella sp. M17.18 TaxID=3234247 RepID=UPI0034E00440
MLTLELSPEVNERLETLAKRTGRSKSFFAEEAILRQIEDLEDVYLAEQELAEVRAGRSRTRPLADVMKTYGVED